MSKYFCTKEWAIRTFEQRTRDIVSGTDEDCPFCTRSDDNHECEKTHGCEGCPLRRIDPSAFHYEGMGCNNLHYSVIVETVDPDNVIDAFRTWANEQPKDDWEQEE